MMPQDFWKVLILLWSEVVALVTKFRVTLLSEFHVNWSWTLNCCQNVFLNVLGCDWSSSSTLSWLGVIVLNYVADNIPPFPLPQPSWCGVMLCLTLHHHHLHDIISVTSIPPSWLGWRTCWSPVIRILFLDTSSPTGCRALLFETTFFFSIVCLFFPFGWFATGWGVENRTSSGWLWFLYFLWLLQEVFCFVEQPVCWYAHWFCRDSHQGQNHLVTLILCTLLCLISHLLLHPWLANLW